MADWMDTCPAAKHEHPFGLRPFGPRRTFGTKSLGSTQCFRGIAEKSWRENVRVPVYGTRQPHPAPSHQAHPQSAHSVHRQRPTTAPDRNPNNTNTNASKPTARCKTTQPSGVAINPATERFGTHPTQLTPRPTAKSASSHPPSQDPRIRRGSPMMRSKAGIKCESFLESSSSPSWRCAS